MPPTPPKKKPVSDFASAFKMAAAGGGVETPVVNNTKVEEAPKPAGKSEFALALEEASKKKVDTADLSTGSTPSATPTSNSEAPSPSTESTPIPSTNGYNIATLNGAIQPEGTFKNETAKPEKDFISQLTGNAKRENGVLTVHDTRAVKGGQDLPDIKQAIDATVEKNIKRKRGVYDKTLPPPTKDEIAAEAKSVTEAYKRGDIVPAKEGDKSVMKRGTGFLESLVNGINETAKINQENEYFASLSKADKIKFLNQNRENPEAFNPQPQTAPTGVGGAVGAFIGENAGMLSKGAVGAMTATAAAPAALLTGASNFGSFLALANEFGNGGYRSGFEKTYYSLKQQGLSDEEAADKAENVGLIGAATQTAVGAVLSGSIHAPELKAAEPAVNGMIEGIVKSAGNMLKTEAPKMAVTSAGASLVESGAQAAVGVDVNAGEALKAAVEAGGHGALIGAAFWALHEPLRIPSYLRPQAENIGASIPVEAREKYLNTAVEQGIITEEQKIQVSKTINEFGETKKPIQDLPIPEEKKAAITGKLVQAKKIQEEIDSLTPYGASFNDRIAQLTAQKEEIHADVNRMYGAEDVFALERDSLTGESPITAPAVLRPEEINRPTTEIGIAPDETLVPETKQSGAAVVLPQSNREPNIVSPNTVNNEELKNQEVSVQQGNEGTTVNNEPVTAEEGGGTEAATPQAVERTETPLRRDEATGILHREAPIEIKEEVRNKFEELDKLRNAITEEGANRKERKNAVDKFLQENPHVDAVDRHFSNITKELEANGLLKKSSAECP